MGISQLESGDHRSLGTLHGGRIQHPISHNAVSTSRTIPSSFFTRRGTGSARAAGGVTTEGCHQGSIGPTLLRQHLVSAAEGRQPLASYFQFEESERVCGDVPLQNGDNSPAERCSDTAQFHVQSRSVRRVPFYPGVYSTSGVSAVPLERTPLELHLPSLRFGGCSSSFYEGASPGCEALEGTRGDPPGLSGRLAHYRGQSSGSSECGRGGGRPAGAVRIQSQPEEVHLVSEASSSIFGYGRRCHLDDPQPAQRQIAEVASRMSTPSSPWMGDGSRTSLNLGKDGGGIAGDQSSSTTCSGLAVPLARFSPRHCPSGRMGTARSSVVEREGTFAELQPNHPSSSQQDHHDRCLQLGLGGSLRSCPNNGSMAQRGTVKTYQLEGAVCHLPGIDDLCRSGQEYDCTRGERQSDRGCIREQAGRNTVVDTVQTSTGSMAVGNRPSTSSDCRARSGTGQRGSGCSLPEASPVNNRVGTSTSPVCTAGCSCLGAPCARPFCSSPQCSSAAIRELEARSSGNGDRRVQHPCCGLGECVCFPSFQPCGSVFDPRSSGTDWVCSTGGTSVATPTVVPTPSTTTVSSTASTSGAAAARPIRESPSVTSQPSTRRVDYLRSALQERGLSKAAQDLWLSSWRSSTNATYDSAWRQFDRWCGEREIDCFSATPTVVSNFLSDEFGQGKAYRTLNVYRSAISTALPPSDGQPIGQHQDVCHVMRGVYHTRPPQPRYSQSWNVSAVLNQLQTWGANANLPTNLLSWKLVLLLALTRAPRVGELQALDCRFMQQLPDGILFQLQSLTKTQRSGGPRTFFFPSFSEIELLCPVKCLRAYIERTATFRPPAPEPDPLFLAIPNPHHPVSTDTLSRWLKSALDKCGVDVQAFKAHSTRGAATTSAREQGVTLEVIMATADWSRPHTFITHYYRPHSLVEFGRSVLRQCSGTSATSPSVSLGHS